MDSKMPLPMFLEKNKNKPIRHLIGISSGKGGVGKSTVTVHLALALQAKGFKVGVLDADLYGPSIRKMLPEKVLPKQSGKWIYPADANGILTVSMSYFRPDYSPTAIRAPIANRLLTQFLEEVAWGELDYLLIDFPPGTGDIQLTLSQKAFLSGVIVVTTPQEISLLDVRKAIYLFKQMQVPLLGIVENMSYYLYPETSEKLFLFGRGGGKKLAEEFSLPLLASIPIQPEISKNTDAGVYPFDENPLPFYTQVFIELSKKMVQAIETNGASSFEILWKEMNK